MVRIPTRITTPITFLPDYMFYSAMSHFGKLKREHANTAEKEELYEGLYQLAQALTHLEGKIDGIARK